MIKTEKTVTDNVSGREHSITLENKSKLSLSGIKEVSEFSDNKVELKTNMGGLCIKGKSLTINQLNTDTGLLEVKGEISQMFYVNKGKDGFFAGLFK